MSDNHLQIGALQKKDSLAASNLDKKWFGEYGISTKELEEFITDNPSNNLAVFQNNSLIGFTTFEILLDKMPQNYNGNIISKKKVLFIQQFTTNTNYRIDNQTTDRAMISEVEKIAKMLGCDEVCEALAIDHPYKKENNPEFDAFGFYESQGYTVDTGNTIFWQPDQDMKVPCFLFRKKI